MSVQQTHKSRFGPAVDEPVSTFPDPSAQLCYRRFHRRIIALAGAQIYRDIHALSPFSSPPSFFRRRSSVFCIIARPTAKGHPIPPLSCAHFFPSAKNMNI